MSKGKWVMVLAFVVVWPMVVVGLAGGVYFWRTRQVSGASYKGQAAPADSPRSAVLALWAAEDEKALERLEKPRTRACLDALTKASRARLEQHIRRYKERQIDSDEKLEADRWKVKASLTLFDKGDDNGVRRVTYIVLKDADKWKVSEAREDCGMCKGTGTRECYFCDGTGKRRTFSLYGVPTKTCDECGGSGRVKCSSCDGKGWVDTLTDTLGWWLW